METERRGMGVSPMISLRKALRRGPHHTGRMPVLPLFIHPLRQSRGFFHTFTEELRPPRLEVKHERIGKLVKGK